ncbi:MAG: outer membrane lipoprotein chaperone LolA [Gemmatimonadota bacterium]|nr:outer membrane lipoprotein chaperone LolA [Gemmatimonadota bacterium]
MKVVAAMLLSASIAAPRQSTDATLDRAVAAYAKVKTLNASFTQSITNPLTGSAITSRGEMLQQIPGKLSVRFTDPAGDRIVADGKAVWVYLPSTDPKQVLKLRAGEGVTGTPDVTAQFLESPKSRYTVSDAGKSSIAGRPAHALLLVPRQAGMPFSKATIWVDDADNLVRQFETVQGDGVVRRVTITRLAINGPVDAAAFTFVPPKGVSVFDQSR